MDRFNQVARATELLPEPRDLYINRSIGHWVIFSMNGIDDLVPREDPARTLGKKVEHFELGGGEFNHGSIDEDFVPSRMDCYVMEGNNHIGIGICSLLGFSPEDGADPRQQHPWAERFR